LKKLLLCLALFIGGFALTAPPCAYAACSTYVAPDSLGIRVGNNVPYGVLSSSEKSNGNLLPNKFYNITPYTPVNPPDWGYGCWECPSNCCNHYWLYGRYFVWNGTCGDYYGHGSTNWCIFQSYIYTEVPGQTYNSSTYDFDCDGTFDIADANPDTPPSQVVKGDEEVNTSYDNKTCDTQGCCNESQPCRGMPGLVVNLANLNFVLQDKDIAYADIGRSIEIERSYNAYSTYQGIFGRGWTFNYGVHLVADASGNITVMRGSGAEKLFTRKTDGTYTPPKGVHDKLTRNADGTFSLWSKQERLTYAFTATGLLSSVTDTNNNAVTLSRDASGRPTTITDAAGRNTTFTYNSDNQVATITDPLGRPITFTYESGNMKTSTDLAGVTTTFTYDPTNNYLTSMATPLGSTSFTYQDYPFGRRLASVTNAANLTTLYAINAPNQEVLVTDPKGHATHYGYNYDGYTTYITDPLGNKTSYGYDAAGNRTSITDANNKKTTIAYDSRGNILSITDPLTKITSFTYDTRDNLTQTKDPLNRIYGYTYDTHDNLTRITDPLTQQTNFAYNTKGELVSLSDARGNTATFTYDQAGNLLSITDPLNNAASFTYNLIGQQQTATDPLGNTSSFEYDPLGRLIRRIHADGAQFIIERYCSGISGLIDENGKHTAYDHNAINMLTKVHDPMGHQTSYAYDPAGNLTQLKDPLNQATSYTYDVADRLSQQTYPEGAQEQYTYDPTGNLLTKTDANGVTTAYTYDAVNRLLSITAPDLSIGYTYDAVGNLLTMTDAAGTTSYAYDSLNRLTNITYPTGVAIGYAYNEVGRITSIATPYGTVGYGYDDANRLTTITLPNAQQVIYQYDAAGNLLQVVYPNGTAAAYAYDTRNRLTAMTNFAPNNAIISTYAYTLDGVGNRTQVDLNEPMMPSYNAETINYTYSLGNILSTADGNTYTHDSNGNRTSKTNGATVTNYSYDSLNRLTQTSTTGRTIQYIYNGLGQRVGKIDNGVQTNYLVDPNGILPQVLAETDASNNLISFYVYDGAGLVAKITPQNQYYFYHFDGLGSTIAITDSNGQVVNTYCYSPEGLVGAQETIPNPFTYVGRFGVMAEGNGLYYMRARYQDPETGSFISKDPIGFAGGLNLFAYVKNNPVNLRDPYGLLWLYHSGTGRWEHQDDLTGVITYVGYGYAGSLSGGGYNNTAMQNIENVGPLPIGFYTIGPQQGITTSDGRLLRAAMELTPDPENIMFGRPGRWFFHGFTQKKGKDPYDSSEGCPVAGRTLRDKIGKSPDRRLLVIE
jgi:RHS repeat-associated protein